MTTRERDPGAARDVNKVLTAVMPRKSGSELAAAVQALRPGTTALFMSGYTADIVRQKRVVYNVAPLLSKPILPNRLLRAIRKALDGKPSRARSGSRC